MLIPLPRCSVISYSREGTDVVAAKNGDHADADADTLEEMECKALALDSLALYAPLGEPFVPFLDKSMEVALDALQPSYSETVIEVSPQVVVVVVMVDPLTGIVCCRVSHHHVSHHYIPCSLKWRHKTKSDTLSTHTTCLQLLPRPFRPAHAETTSTTDTRSLIPSLMYAAKAHKKLDPASEDVNTVLNRLVDATIKNFESSVLAML